MSFRARRTSRSALVAAAAVLLLLLIAIVAPPPAHASIGDVATIDGPSADIAELGGVAMSSDGTGGIAYRKFEDGRPHIFAAQVVGGAWRPARRVDVGQAFDSSWPVIAAGDGGRLVVAWVQEFGAADRLYAASLAPGAGRFQAPVPVDLNVGDGTLGTQPSIAMARGGQAYLAYRVVTTVQAAGDPAGSVQGEYRLARFGGQYWSGLGITLDRNSDAAQPAPATGNGPRVALDLQGNGVVAWTEFDDQFVARVYARRLVSGAVGIPLQVSPATISEAPASRGADVVSVDVGDYGQAAVAWRERATGKAPLEHDRVLVAESPDIFSSDAKAFAAPRYADDGAARTVGPPAVAAQTGVFTTTFTRDANAILVGGAEDAVAAPQRLDDGNLAADGGDPQVVLAPSSAAAYGWRARNGIVMLEHTSDDVDERRLLSTPVGGAVDQLMFAGSGAGDAVAGFAQGTGARRQIAAAVIDAPPAAFNAHAPIGWLRTKTALIEWDESVHAIGDVTYSVVVDDETIVEGLKRFDHTLALADIDDGTHVVQIVATDSAGQETTSVPTELTVDRTAPTASVRSRGRSTTVTVTDGKKGQAAGVRTTKTRIWFGDGGRAAGRRSARHRYRRPGTFRVVVRSTDRVGNTRATRRTVKVR